MQQNTSIQEKPFESSFSEPRGLEPVDDGDDDIKEDDHEPEMRNDENEEQEELEPGDRQLWGRRPSRRCVRYLGRSLRCLRWSDEAPRRPAALPLPWWAFLWRG